MAVYRTPEYPFSFDASVRPYDKGPEYNSAARISPSLDDDSLLVRWYDVETQYLPSCLIPSDTTGGTTEDEIQAVSAVNLIAATKQHIEKLQEYGAKIVNTDYRLSRKGTPESKSPGILFTVPLLPLTMTAVNPAMKDHVNLILAPFGKYLEWSMTQDVVLSDAVGPDQWSYDTTSAAPIPVMHDTEPRTRQIQGPSGNLGPAFYDLIEDILDVAETAGVGHPVPVSVIRNLQPGMRDSRL